MDLNKLYKEIEEAEIPMFLTEVYVKKTIFV